MDEKEARSDFSAWDTSEYLYKHCLYKETKTAAKYCVVSDFDIN